MDRLAKALKGINYMIDVLIRKNDHMQVRIAFFQSLHHKGIIMNLDSGLARLHLPAFNIVLKYLTYRNSRLKNGGERSKWLMQYELSNVLLILKKKFVRVKQNCSRSQFPLIDTG